MYDEKILKRVKNIKYTGEMKNADAVGEVINSHCGDIMEIYLKIKKNKIDKIRFKTYGCLAAVVSTDCMCELAEGKTLDEAERITGEDIMNTLGGKFPPLKIHCTALSLKALKKAIKNYRKRN
ncbi:MAG: iron-sulfur cluster assembly scaffold protein [Nanoarchaeota archaeon]|nr:iron-sulfur cluster assembly scaffold protein [Nanoarchaeota archaeon]